MADFLYNGVELPDINTVWTDKETYPYAYITTVEGDLLSKYLTNMGLSSYIGRVTIAYELRLLTQPIVQNYVSGYTWGYSRQSPTGIISYAYSPEMLVVTSSWLKTWEGTEQSSQTGSLMWSKSNWVWVNSNMVSADGSTYLAASTPIRVDSKLKISVGGATDTTATVEFTCTDLENTEPIDCIKAWVYKKSDGLNTTIPPTWTSEMFSAPEFSTTHTFTGLTPNTEYEVYGCIFVNGEATDHNAIAEFTTLEGSGDIKPVYKRVDGTWAKKTAYEWQNGEWVLISTAAM